MRNRFLALILAVVLVAALLPVPAASADAEVDPILQQHIQMQDQIRRIRNMTIAYTGWHSFQGYCATWVTWQIYLMGIDTTRVKLDGNQLYDYYCQLDYSSGGYKITPYSGYYYTIEQVLMMLTENGTQDAYNILIGIERTPSADGQRYGHGVFIHAIIDGMVHFTESNATFIAGTYWPEGYPVMCTIQEFVDAYKSWVTLDGIIHFGLKRYTNQCTVYPANSYAMSLQEQTLYTEPCTPEVDSSSKLIASVTAGEILEVTGLYHTPEGKYWYQVRRNGKTGFVEADTLHVLKLRYDDVVTQNVGGFSTLHQGSDYTLYGDVCAQANTLDSITVSVYLKGSDQAALVAQLDTDQKTVSLSEPQIKEALAVHTLAAGEYDLEISASVQNYIWENGQPTAQKQKLTLWNSRFQVIDSWDAYPTVSFDGCGGTPEINQMVMLPGQAIGPLPEASRPGYRFEGWYTAQEDGEKLTADYLIQGETTLYAAWTPDESNLDGWVKGEDGAWSYYLQGVPHSGWLDYQGLRFYTHRDGERATGWCYAGQRLRYFNAAGMLESGWLEIDSVLHYLEEDGTGAEGWKTIDGKTYYFHNYGEIKTGWLHDSTGQYYLGQDGAPVTSWQQMDGQGYLFDSNGKLQMIRHADGTYTVLDRKSAGDLLAQGVPVQLG